MDLDGFIKLDDQQIKEADSQATIAGKWIANEIAWQAAEKAALENLAKAIKIRGDVQAHDQLIRIRNQALQLAERTRRERSRLNGALRHVHALLAGSPALDAVTYGWLGFAYLRDRVPIGATVGAARIVPPATSYGVDAWCHPTHAVPPLDATDPGHLLAWAARHNCYPRWGGPAYVYTGDYLQALADAATATAAEIQARIEVAEKAALALEERDWDRLKTP